MAHTSIPNNFFTLPAVLIAGEAAAILHLHALLWSNEHGVSDIPAEALPMLSGRSDAGELALRLVGAGLWTQTATGWSIGDAHARHVSAVRSAAGKRSGEVRRERKEQRTNKTANTTATPVEQPRTVHAGARQSSDSEGTEESRRETTPYPSTPTTPEANRKVAVVTLSLDPEAERVRALFVEAAGEHFVPAVQGPMRDEFARRLAAYRPADDVVRAMGALCATPKAVWDWATNHGGGPVTIPWLLNRDGAQLAQLVSKARSVVASQRKALSAPQRPQSPVYDSAAARQQSLASRSEAEAIAERMKASERERAERRKMNGVPASPEFIRASVASARAGFPPCTDEERRAAVMRGAAESRARRSMAA